MESREELKTKGRKELRESRGEEEESLAIDG